MVFVMWCASKKVAEKNQTQKADTCDGQDSNEKQAESNQVSHVVYLTIWLSHPHVTALSAHCRRPF